MQGRTDYLSPLRERDAIRYELEKINSVHRNRCVSLIDHSYRMVMGDGLIYANMRDINLYDYI